MTECLGSVAILLLLALVFETGLVAEGLWATADGTTLFLAQTAMTIVLSPCPWCSRRTCACS